MRVVVVSGIWPPDSAALRATRPRSRTSSPTGARGRGRDDRSERSPPRARTRCTGRRAARRFVTCGPRCSCAGAARRADVVYATSMIRRASIGSRLARRPLVVKLVSDEVFERATRSGRYVGTLDEFQRTGGGVRTRFLRATRNAALRRARHVFCPSAYLRDVALRWGLDPGRVSVLPNPAPETPVAAVHVRSSAPSSGSREMRSSSPAASGRRRRSARAGGARRRARRDAHGCRGWTERAPSSVELASSDSTAASPSSAAWPAGRCSGSFARPTRPSCRRPGENFPHTVVEALAVGCPVIATAVGGVPEVVKRRRERPPRAARRSGCARCGDRAVLWRRRLRARLADAAPRSVEGTPSRRSSRRSKPSCSG